MNPINRKDLFRDICFYLMIIIVVGLSIYVIMFLNNDSMKCMTSPWTYTAAHLTSSSGRPVSCSCSADGAGTIFFNSTGMWADKMSSGLVNSGNTIADYNFSYNFSS